VNRYKENRKKDQLAKERKKRREKERPTNAVFPYLDGNAWRVAGDYSNPGYGTKHLCLLHPKINPPGAPGPCKELERNADKVFPGVREEAEKNNVTTLVARLNNPFVGWMLLKWWDGGVWNYTSFNSFVRLACS
jgi:hypothetical protein